MLLIVRKCTSKTTVKCRPSPTRASGTEKMDGSGVVKKAGKPKHSDNGGASVKGSSYCGKTFW